MLAKADTQKLHLRATEVQHSRENSVLEHKIWLPNLVYDCLPYFYLTAGFAAIFATLYISDWFWVMPHYLLFSAACMHLAYEVYRRRKAGNGKPLTTIEEATPVVDG